MEYSVDERAIIWLCACSGLDYRTIAERLRTVRQPSRLMDAEKIRAAEDFLRPLKEEGVFLVTLVSDDYPENLRAIHNPPFVLYGMGNRALLRMRRFCIVGSRIIPPWAEKVGKKIAEDLTAKFAVVTGLAEGGDFAAISGALASGNLISVLPCGILECYPAGHFALKERIKKSGLLLSEYMPHETTTKYAFHARNRILAGLSEGVLVLSAGQKSGTLITANCALEYGRDVFALPHNAGVSQGEGCNELIKKGAYLVTSSRDILANYGFSAGEPEPVSLTETEKTVMKVLREKGEIHIAKIAEETGMPVHAVAAVLSALEIKGCAVKAGGNRYSAT